MRQPDGTVDKIEARRLEWRWDTGQRIEGSRLEPGKVMVVLEVGYNKWRKRYEAELYTIEAFPTGTRRSFRLADPERTTVNSSALVSEAPVARFGAKQFRLFADAAFRSVMAGEVSDDAKAFLALVL